ncbi:MAG: N-acetylmuramoyl-L-alanine amidase [Clostridia bacterium]|nr:N-acetylmuramoyl-L-alanine amidase [Clostridia bacterium]
MTIVIEENLDWNGSLELRHKTELIVLHHAATSKCTVQDIHQWHLNRGWTGIGYHYFVRKDGSVYRGRPRDTVGAHAYNYDFNSIGICAEGNYEVEQMPEAQLKAIITLVAELEKIYPDAKVVGHRELNATVCPGANFPMEQIKAGKIGIEKVTVKVKGKEIEGYIINGHTHVPVRDIIDALTYEVKWDGETRTVIVE